MSDQMTPPSMQGAHTSQGAPTPQGSPLQKTTKNGLAIAGLVLGIIGVCLSWAPIINNLALILGLLGGIFSVIAVIKGVKHQVRKGVAIAALILNGAALVISLLFQQAYVNAIDDAMKGGQAAAPAATSSAPAASGNAQQASPDKKSFDDLKLGESASFKNGAHITVTGVESGLTASYTDKTYTRVEVTIVNEGKDHISFNSFDWKGENAQGTMRDTTYYDKATDELHSGELSPGGKVVGNLYFEGTVTKAAYIPGLDRQPAATWVLS